MTLSHLPLYALAFLAGVFTLFSMPSLEVAHSLSVISSGILGLLLLPKKWRTVSLYFIFAYIWAGLFTSNQLAKSLPLELAGKNITVDGHIAGLPDKEGHIVRFNLDVFHSDGAGGRKLRGRIRVSDYRKHSLNPQPGEAWRLLLRVKPVHGFANPAGFDYEKWLFKQKIIATAYIREPRAGDEKNNLVNHRLPELDQPAYIDNLRRTIANQIDTSLADSSLSGIITALATGDRRAISAEQWQILQKTGTSHLMAISGLHVGLVAGIAFFIFQFLFSRIANLALYFPAHKLAVIAAFLFAGFYSLLSGFSLPTQRALLMLSLLSVAILSDRQVRALDILSLTLLVVLLFDPLSVLSAGFWLSFSAVAMIIYTVLFRQYRQGWVEKKAVKTMRLQWKLSLMMAPLGLLFFQLIPLTGPFANIIAIPVVALLIVPMVLLASLLFLAFGNSLAVQYLYQLAAFLLQQLWVLLEGMASVSDGLEFLPEVSVVALTGLLFFLLTILLPAGIRVRRLAAVGLLVFFLPLHPQPREGEFRMILLDVGQGLSVIIKTGQHSLVFDTGARFSKRFDAGKAVILPVLKSLSINRLDKLLISHGDNDHNGGTEAVLAGINVQQLMSNENFSNDVSRDYQVNPCRAGQQWVWEGVSFSILHPQDVASSSGNNRSCVLRVHSAYGSVLLPADIEKESEQKLLSRHPGALSSTILVAPHHGSKTSSSHAFLQAVSPRLVLIPAGWMNRYKHPSNKVLARLSDRGLRHLTTGECGAIDIQFQRGGISVQAMRQQARRIWDRTETDRRCRKVLIGLSEIPVI